MMLAAVYSFGGIYYVSPSGDDGASGSAEAPWKTASQASSQAGPGDTIVFLPGDYPDALIPRFSGTKEAPIVFKSSEPRAARLAGRGSVPRIRLDGRAHIRIEGLHVEDTSPGRSGSRGVLQAVNSSHVTLDNCHFTGGYIWKNFLIEDSDNIKITNSDFERDRYRGDLIFLRNIQNLLLEGNSFRKVLHTGVGISFSENVVVRGNVFHMGTGRNFSTNENDRTLVENNIFTNAYNGSLSAWSSNQTAGNRMIVRHNQVFRNYGMPWEMVIFGAREIRHNRVYNNVFDGNHGVAWVGSGHHSNYQDVILKNNIFSRNDPFGSWTQLVISGGGHEGTRVVNNGFFAEESGSDTLLLYYKTPLSLEQAELAGEGTAPYGGIFSNNLETAPQFEDPVNFDFSLSTGSPLRAKGAGLTTTRSAGAGSQLPVADVYYFYDGFGIEGEKGDTIAVGDPSVVAEIVSIDYENRVLTLDRELQWESGASVGFPWAEGGPALGLYEYGEGGRPSVQAVVSRGEITPGESVTIQAVARGLEGALEYRWLLGDGNVAEGETVTHTYEAAGDYGIRVRVTDGAGLTWMGVGYLVVEAETDPAVFMHTTFDADDQEWWKHWQFYRGRAGTGYSVNEHILDEKTGEGYHRIAALDGIGPLPALLHPKEWNVDEYPKIRLRYRIRPGSPIAILVQPHPSADHVFNGRNYRQDTRRYYFAGTPAEQRGNRTLIDDGEWHEITFDARDIRKDFPEVDVIMAMQIGDLEVDGGTAVGANDEFWLDEIYIGKFEEEANREATGMGVQRRGGSSASKQGFQVIPKNIPNQGILFVNHEEEGRSGHGGNTLVEAANGDILAFYSSVSGDEWHGGHSVAGWSEYRRSTDGGKTWGDPIVFDYSKETWEGDEVFSALVFTVNRTPNGNLVAVLPRFADPGWNKKLSPVYFISHDHGATWEGPRDLDPNATVEELSMTYNGSFVCPDTGTMYLICIGGVESMCPGPHSLYASTDNGETFEKRSELPFPHHYTYGTGAVLDDGSLIVYSYPFRGRNAHDDQTGTPADSTDEQNAPYVISQDGGRTWSEIQTTHFSKRLRNGQMSPKVGNLYFMHGRSGLYGDDPRNLVLYTSRNGTDWDEGLLLKRNSRLDGDSYSANTVIGGQAPDVPDRLLIQSSVAYDGRFRVNSRHWWLVDIEGTD